jgi:uncharacterized protein (TIGR03382 family)
MRGHLIVVALIALVPLRARTSDACSSEPVSAAANVPVLPVEGSVAPTNTSIWIPPPINWYDEDLDPARIVVEQNGTPVDVTTHQFLVDDDVDHHGLRLEPATELVPGATVVVRAGETLVTRFTVGTERDDTPPDEPELIRVDVDGGYFGAFSCPEDARVAIRFATPPPSNEVFVLASRGVTSLPDIAFGITANTWLIGTGLAEGEHQMRVLAVDLANNASYADVPTFTVPGEQSGCAATASASRAWPLFALVSLVLRRRRRR